MPESRQPLHDRISNPAYPAYLQKRLGIDDAIKASHAEARNSGFPGGGGGPQDAYRHLLIIAELVRTEGEMRARTYAHLNEIQSDIRRAQSREDRAMDDHNNAIGLEIGKKERNWEDVVRVAREKILEAARHDGDGKDGRVFWYNKPADPDWNPDIRNLQIAPNTKGSEDHHYDAPGKAQEGGSGGPPREEGARPAAPARSSGATDRRSDAGAPAMSLAAREIERFALAGEEPLEEVLGKPPARLMEREIDRLIAAKTVMRLGDPLRAPAEEAVSAAFRHIFPRGSSPLRSRAAQSVPAISPDGRPVADGGERRSRPVHQRRCRRNHAGGRREPAGRAQPRRPDLLPLKRDGIFGDRTRARLRGVVARRGAGPVLNIGSAYDRALP